MCVIFIKTNVHTQGSTEKCLRSPFIFVTCVQNMRISMDHKGVCAQALTWGLVQGSTSLLDFVSWTCEVFRLTYTNTTSCFVDSDYPKIFVRLVRLLLRPLERDSWTETNYRLPQGNVCLMILCTRCLWCVWRKLTIIRQRLFLKL